MKSIKSLMTGAAMALALAGPAMAQDPTKVGFIYVGPIGDLGWLRRHMATRSKPVTSKVSPKAPMPNAC